MIPAVVAIFIATTEALAEVIVIIVLGNVIATIPVVRVLIGIGVLVVGAPPILTIGISGEEALFITVIYGFPKHIRAVLIGFVVAATAVVTIIRRRVKVRIIVVVVAITLEVPLLLIFVR